MAVGQAGKTTTETTAVTSVSTSTQTVTSTSAVVDSVIYSNVTDGIQLSAVIQPATAAYGQNITVVADVRDVLSTNIQPNASALDNPAYGPCEQAFATGVYVYRGHYSSVNVSEASQLLLYNPSLIYACPVALTQHYSFTPIQGVSETSLLTGYWTGSGQNYVFQKFPTGDYTVVVFDAWGQTAVGYFHIASTAAYSARNLELELSLSTASSASGVAVNASVDVYNPLASTVNATADVEWRVPLNGGDGAPCWQDSLPVGLAIASGYYTSSNVTTAEFLDLVDPGATYNCPLYLGYANPTGFVFQPMSDMAASYGCIGQSQCMSGSASTGVSVTGYWNLGESFTSFPRGVYTVVAEDERGDSALAHFTVP